MFKDFSTQHISMINTSKLIHIKIIVFLTSKTYSTFSSLLKNTWGIYFLNTKIEKSRFQIYLYYLENLI